MTGKLADTVMSVRNGEQIARKYQPVVFNPSTPAQVAVRAKLKLLSQLSAIMAPVIAIRRVGSVSSRNLFTKKNYPSVTYNDNNADINLLSVKITDGVLALPPITAPRGEGGIAVNLQVNATDLSRVVYVAFRKEVEEVRFLGSAVATEPGTINNWPATLPGSSEEVYVYAYGIRDNNENARASFGNLFSPTAEQVARIIVARVVSESDVTITETKSVRLAAPSRGDDPEEKTKKSK